MTITYFLNSYSDKECTDIISALLCESVNIRMKCGLYAYSIKKEISKTISNVCNQGILTIPRVFDGIKDIFRYALSLSSVRQKQT